MQKQKKANTTHEFDAAGQSVGRLAAKIAAILIGKNSVNYTAYLDNNNQVVVSNVDKIKLSGKKWEQKEYIHHSLHPGGLKREPIKKVMAKDPRKILVMAVSRMLPKNKLRIPRLKRLLFK